MWVIFKKELFNYFSGFIGYVTATTFVIICSLFLWFFDNQANQFNIFIGGNASLNNFFFIAPWVMLFIVPALTMRSFSDEEASGTLQWLFTQPIKLSGIVLGKYFSIIVLLLFSLIPTVWYVATISHFIQDEQTVEYGVVFSGYLGLILLISMFTAIGVLISSLTKNQVLAYVGGLFACFVFFFAFGSLASYNLLGSADYYVQKIGAQIHYSQFLKGIVDTRDVLYFLVIISVVNGLTFLKLQSKK